MSIFEHEISTKSTFAMLQNMIFGVAYFHAHFSYFER